MPLTPAQRLGQSPLQPEVALPAINVKAPSISAITHAIVSNLPSDCGLFRRYDSYITIDIEKDVTPEGVPTKKTIVREMTPTRLCSWLEQFMCFRNGGDDQAKATTLGKQMVEKIMASDTFRNAVREVREIAHVRLPIWASDDSGQDAVTLAEPGYNSRLKLFVSPEIEYHQKQYTPAQIQRIWRVLVKEYPFLSESAAEESQKWVINNQERMGPDPRSNRSACCALALLVGTYVRYLYDRAPMFIFNGNQPGTGKTLLMVMCLAPVWGVAAGGFIEKPDTDDEMTKVLNMMALESKPFCIFDDVTSVISTAINEFSTSPLRTGRILGSGKSFTVPCNTQIIFTGNGLATTPDIVRRSLIVDLWYSGEAIHRELANPTKKEDFFKLAWRGDMLTLCWSMVKNWLDQGARLTTPPSAKPSFESFAEIVGSILAANGFADPFQKRDVDVAGGDMIGSAVTKLIKHIAWMQRNPKDEYGKPLPPEKSKTYTVGSIIGFSDALGFTETITRGKNPNVTMGKQLSKYRGRAYTDKDGMPFIFGRGESAESSNYTFVLLDPEKSAPI